MKAEPSELQHGFWRRVHIRLNADDLMRDLLIAVVAAGGLAIGLAAYTNHLDGRRSDRAEMLENTRFVRTVAMDPDPTIRPFQGIYLEEARLSGLDLSCDPAKRGPKCADFRGADFRNADLTYAVLSGSNFTGADFTGAKLRLADLRGATFDFAVLTNTDLTRANVTGASFQAANLDEAADSGVCYETDPPPSLGAPVWPAGFVPKPPVCPGSVSW